MREKLLRYLQAFIAFRTTSEDLSEKKRCLDWVEKNFLQSVAVNVQRGEVDGSPYLYVPHPHAKLLWFAHIDVVPGEEEQFSLKMDKNGDTVLGRGAKDMKGAALPYLMAFSEACAAGDMPPVSILLTSDEETAGEAIPKLLAQGMIHAPVAFTPDTGSNPFIVVKHKGAVWGELIAEGRGGHAAMPWDADNPIPRLADAIQKISQHFPVGTAKDWQMTVSFGELKGSGARNQIPATAKASVDIRYLPEVCRTPKEAVLLVEKELPSGCSIEILRTADALNTDTGHPMVLLLQSISQEVTGKKVEIGREHGASDARYFEDHGIPAFLYGPIGGNLHAPDEWVSLSSLLDQYEIAKRLFEKLRK